MLKVDGKEISKEMMAEAMKCDSPEELVKLAKERGIGMTKEQAEAYLAELADFDLDSEQLRKVAGGFGEADKDYEAPTPGSGECKMKIKPYR